MPLFIAAIWGACITVAGSIAVQIVVALGIGVVTYTGINSSLTYLKTQAVAGLTGMGPEIVGMLATMNVGTCISIIFSATVTRFVLQGLASDTFKSFVKK